MKQLVVILTSLFTWVPALAQRTLTLEECLRIGIENNLSLAGSRNELRKAKHLLSENRAKLLPQINAVAGFNDNFNPPVSVTDGSAYGNPYNVTKTLQYNASAGLQLQMPLYNQTVYTAIDIARTMNELNRLSYEKAREDLILQISKMYYLGQNTVEQLALIQENRVRLQELRDITQAFFDNGMAMEVDVKRVNINLENLQVQYDNAKSMLVQQLNLLKYVMDYPAEEEIALTPVNPEQVESVSLTGLRSDLYELQLLESQKKLAGQQKDLIRQGYLPSLSLTGSWMYSAYTDKARHWFHSGPSNHWYPSSGLGLTLRVPIFDGLDKRARIRKAQIDEENARLNYENMRKNMETQYLNATNDLMNNQRNFQKQKDNYLLAEEVYQVTTDRYREGIASMTEVLQDEMRMSEAQNNYLSAHYNYQVANLTLLKLTGQLDRLFQTNTTH
ncbi:MAG TPA: TolC family protein [Bacteroides mediterraneensis]|uniref:TolC family protein n=1 Tax=Bacteroides mediterraneensis TaxID=1841856 RepID=UPI00261CF8FE|nr:TolC family protein [Bacteroides mediterraneensis]HJH65789.1 TolC family protein [Bacteroides mediterraneensis]